MKLRRCQEEKEFTKEDNHMWPMYVIDGGTPFSFCPGKATWDRSATSTFRLLVVCAETGSLYSEGGIGDQPDWFIELLGWFLPRYNDLKFISRARFILGDGDGKRK